MNYTRSYVSTNPSLSLHSPVPLITEEVELREADQSRGRCSLSRPQRAAQLEASRVAPLSGDSLLNSTLADLKWGRQGHDLAHPRLASSRGSLCLGSLLESNHLLQE